jgi:hypothetical protein
VNVMVSRGKNIVIVVGSTAHFKEGKHDFWDQLIDKAEVKSVEVCHREHNVY